MTDIFHAKVPSRIIRIVSNAAYSRDYSKNPFDFKNMGLNYLEITEDGQSVRNRPFRPRYSDYVLSYLHLLHSD